MAAALRDELLGDPEGRGYSGMSNQEALDDLHSLWETRNRASMTASEVLNAVDAGEYTALSNAKENEFWNLMAIGDLNPFGIEAALMINIFGGGSVTITTLQSLRIENISRAEKLGLNSVSARAVGYARGTS